MSSRRLSESEKKVLEDLIGKKINLEVETKYDTFHGDDIDHGEPKTSSYEITLSEILEDGIIGVGSGGGFSRVVWKDGVQSWQSFRGTDKAYFPFYQLTRTHLSESTIKIVSITHEDRVVYER